MGIGVCVWADMVNDGICDKGPGGVCQGKVEVCFQPGEVYRFISGGDVKKADTPLFFLGIEPFSADCWGSQ